MMIKELLRPRTNRNYLGKENHRKQYIYIHLLTLAGAIILLFVVPGLWYIWLALIVLAVIEYFTLDKLSDNLSWKVFGKFYPNHKEPDSEHKAMQEFEKNPNEENAEKLQNSAK